MNWSGLMVCADRYGKKLFHVFFNAWFWPFESRDGGWLIFSHSKCLSIRQFVNSFINKEMAWWILWVISGQFSGVIMQFPYSSSHTSPLRFSSLSFKYHHTRHVICLEPILTRVALVVLTSSSFAFEWVNFAMSWMKLNALIMWLKLYQLNTTL